MPDFRTCQEPSLTPSLTFRHPSSRRTEVVNQCLEFGDKHFTAKRNHLRFSPNCQLISVSITPTKTKQTHEHLNDKKQRATVK